MTVHLHPAGAAPAQAPCRQCDGDAQRIFSVPTLITSYPMDYQQAQEQVKEWAAEQRRHYKRPDLDTLMERSRERAADRERGHERWQGGEV